MASRTAPERAPPGRPGARARGARIRIPGSAGPAPPGSCPGRGTGAGPSVRAARAGSPRSGSRRWSGPALRPAAGPRGHRSGATRRPPAVKGPASGTLAPSGTPAGIAARSGGTVDAAEPGSMRTPGGSSRRRRPDPGSRLAPRPAAAARSGALALRVEERERHHPGAGLATPVLDGPLHGQASAGLVVRSADVRQRDRLLEERGPAPARGVADLPAEAVHGPALAPRHGRHPGREPVLGEEPLHGFPVHLEPHEAPAGPGLAFRLQRPPAVERALVRTHRPAQAQLERR